MASLADLEAALGRYNEGASIGFLVCGLNLDPKLIKAIVPAIVVITMEWFNSASNESKQEDAFNATNHMCTITSAQANIIQAAMSMANVSINGSCVYNMTLASIIAP
eukprot:COSAG01_NODE_256_length_20138_cov_24.233694_15_plen_107_part_00